MKNILLASTALVLTAAAAQAQAVRIGGEGRMGIIYDEVNGVSDTFQENRLQFNFSVAVEGDNGLSFGAFSRARITNGNTGVFSGSRVWVEASGLRLTFGNIDGAVRGAGTSHGYVGGGVVGYIGGYYGHDIAGLLGSTQGFASTGGGNAARARLDYTFGDYRFALSADRNGATEFGVRGQFDAFTAAFGYADDVAGISGDSVATISGHYDAGNWSVGAIVARYDLGGVSTTNGNISATVELGGGELYGFVGRNWDETTYGVNYAYGLGGGARIVAGYETGYNAAGDEESAASLGVVFSF